MRSRPLNWYYVWASSMEFGVSRPSMAEIVGRILGEAIVGAAGPGFDPVRNGLVFLRPGFGA